jgi:hypothetical protein
VVGDGQEARTKAFSEIFNLVFFLIVFLEGADLGTADVCCGEGGVQNVDVIDSLVHSVPVQLHVKPLLHIFETL